MDCGWWTVSNRRLKRICMILIVLGVFLASIGAEGTILLTRDQVNFYEIVEYSFIVEGKTKPAALRELIVPADGDPIFTSEEKMVASLDSKRQELINTRLFTTVFYEYAFIAYHNGIASYAVTFFIEDSKTLLIFPYPKFSNDRLGLLLGTKVLEKNVLGMLGTLTLTASIAQNEGGITGWDKRKDTIELDITGLPMIKTKLDLGFSYERIKGSEEGLAKVNTTVSQLKILGTNLAINAHADFAPDSDFTEWNPQTWGLGFTYGPFMQNGGRYTLKSTVEFEGEELRDIYLTNSITQNNLHFFSLPLLFNIFMDLEIPIDEKIVRSANVSATLGVELPFLFGFRLSASTKPLVEFRNTIDFGAGELTPLSLITAASITRSEIDWVGNFRKGGSLSFSYVRQDYIQANTERDNWHVQGTASWFPFIAFRVNPSIQVAGFYAGGGVKRPFLPSEPQKLGDYFRGFLSSSKALAPFEDADLEWGLITSINLSTDFIDFGFAESYASPFLDIGFFGDSASEYGYHVVSTIGLEGWAILDRYPAYPARASLGLNLDDLRQAFTKAISWKEVEWELFIGFDLHF
ncbi:MAG: hypothetical protein BWY50_01827 [Spirochaetes bacterium ADurb.Bin315]|nr:MAG: hypothetical protein BWY50_01827 [Spirochaetes bacterium ADurb.Bin315]